MGNFRDNRESRGRGFGRDSGGSRGGFGRSSGGRERRFEMHDVVCDKCGKDCQVPFKPSGDKPVLCSNCFERQGNTHGGSFGNRDRPSFSSSSSGVSNDQFQELNKKVDKILEILESIEFEEAEEGDEEDEDSEEESEEEVKAE